MRLQPNRTSRDREDRWEDGELAGFAVSIAGTLQPAPATADPRATATRAAVLGAFAAGTAGVPDRRIRSRSWLALPLAGALVAAGALGVMASSAGQPLYGARLALEEVALPASGAAREAAQVDRLDARIREIVAAQQAADGLALRASLDAFAGIADEAARQAAPDPGDASRVRAQVAELERLRLAGETESARMWAVNAGRGLLATLLGVPADDAPAAVPGIGPGPGNRGPLGPGATGDGSDRVPTPRASSRSEGPGPSGADPAGGGGGAPGPTHQQAGDGSGSGPDAGDSSGGSSSGGTSGGGPGSGGGSGGSGSSGGGRPGAGNSGGSSTGNGAGSGAGQGTGR